MRVSLRHNCLSKSLAQLVGWLDFRITRVISKDNPHLITAHFPDFLLCVETASKMDSGDPCLLGSKSCVIPSSGRGWIY